MTLPLSNGRLGYVDALRGWAVLGVVAVHSAQALAPRTEWLQAVMHQGARGVQLFFLVSALSLGLAWHARFAVGGEPWTSFFIRRFFRIAPLFYLAMVVYPLIYGLGPSYWAPEGIHWWYFPTTALFVHGLYPATLNSIVPGGWSISAEAIFYLMFPVLVVWCADPWRLLGVFAASLVLYVVNKLGVPALLPQGKWGAQFITDFTSLNIIGQLPVFIVGLALCCLHVVRADPRSVILGALPFMVIFVALFYYSVPRVPQHILVSLMLAYCAYGLHYFPVRLLVNSGSIWLGKLSFSVYLVHFAVLHWLGRWMNLPCHVPDDAAAIGVYLLTLAISTVSAAFLFKWVERPGVALGLLLIACSKGGLNSRRCLTNN